MAEEIWIEVRVVVPARMQEEAATYLTEFSGRGVILEEEGAPAGGIIVRAYFRPDEFGDWQKRDLQDYLGRLSGYDLWSKGKLRAAPLSREEVEKITKSRKEL